MRPRSSRPYLRNGERTRAASVFDAARGCACRRSASLLSYEGRSWLGFLFLGVSKARVRKRIARTDKRGTIVGAALVAARFPPRRRAPTRGAPTRSNGDGERGRTVSQS